MSAVSNTIAIFRKELGVYFTTAIAYAGFGAFAFLTGLLFVGSLNRYQSLTDSAVSHQQPEMLERLNVNDLIVMPMFLGTGRHAREDLPVLVREVEARHPGVAVKLRRSVGEDDRVLDLMARIALE